MIVICSLPPYSIYPLLRPSCLSYMSGALSSLGTEDSGIPDWLLMQRYLINL